MLWPKKNSYKEFDNKKNSCSSKIPLPPPPNNNFSNGPSLNIAEKFWYCLYPKQLDLHMAQMTV